ncbi:MAG: hypothetical protein ACI8ZB_000616 [Desulforhopalus sp.]
MIQSKNNSYNQIYPVGAAGISSIFYILRGTDIVPIFEQLEPRILLSADLIPLPVDVDIVVAPEFLEQTDLAQQEISNDTLVEFSDTSQTIQSDNNAVNTNQDDSESTTESAVTNSADQETPLVETSEDSAEAREIIFINDDIEGVDALSLDLEQKENTDIFILNSSEDGIIQINAALNGAENIDALHFFTHANSSSVKLGSSWLDTITLNENKDYVASWGNSLTDDGDILFYGCDLTASSAGEALIAEIAELTGADVAASSDSTGHVSKNGDWVLEYETGEIETIIPVSEELQANWVHILAEETIADNFDSGDYSGSSGTVDWVSDWVEIGESDGTDNGNVLIENGRLHITTANDNETERGISRMADLSEAASAFLSFEVDYQWGGSISIDIRADSSADWFSLQEHSFTILTTATQIRFDISDYIAATTEIRFSSTGANVGGTSTSNGGFLVDNLHIDYTTDFWSTPLLFSTDKEVINGGQTGIEDWNEGDLIGLLNTPSPTLGDTTEGEFSMVAEFSETFAEGADIRSLHYVTTNMDIGGFELNVGDLLFSADGIHLDAPEHPELSSFYGVADSEKDIIHFSPTDVGNYSSGTFTLFLNEITDDKINGFTLVESEVTVGDRTLNAGDILITHDGGDEHSDIYHLVKTDITIDGQPAFTYSTPNILLEGDDAGVQINEKITGLDLVERTVTIGNTTLQEGTLLLSVDNDINVNDWPSALAVNNNDIFALEVTKTSSLDGSEYDLGEVSASMFFDGSDVGFDSNEEEFDALTLTVKGDIPEPTFTGAFFNSSDKTITLTGTDLDYIGDIGTNVKDQLDWSKIVWDINGDGAATSDITFDLTNISTVITSSTTMVINLTGDKTNEITSTPGYAETGGTDTLVITPGFSSNSEGEAATTDGLNTEIITTTGPVGVNLSNTTLDENTDTTGGIILGTLSTTDADSGDTHTYTKIDGGDADLFTIVGNELILDDGILDYETKSSYVVTITVTDGSGQTAEETLTIMVNNINEAPVLVENSFTVPEGNTVVLTPSDLAATDEDIEDPNSQLIFNVVGTDIGGSFVHADTGVTTSFIQADLASGKISFVDDGDETAPSYIIEVSDGTLTDSSVATIDFQPTNDPAEITLNSLTLSEDASVTVTSSDLVITDPDIDPSTLFFRVTTVAGGQFELASAPGDAIPDFTYQQIIDNQIKFQHLGETKPAYTLELTEDITLIGESVADITFTEINDAPTLQKNTLTIDQGSFVAITTNQLLATDPDPLDTPENLTYYITGLSNGYFTVGGLNKTQFTQAEINSGDVIFYDINGANVPAFDVEVKDDEGASSGIHAANIHFNNNEAPIFVTSVLTLDEQETVTLTDSNFLTTDVDSTVTNLSYTVVNDNSIGYFDLDSNVGTPTNTFTQDNINQGKVRYVHLGGEDAPSYTTTVSDGYSTVSPGSNNIHFTNTNDAPVITSNNLTVYENGTVNISDAQLSATDVDIADDSLLTFTITDNVGGYFALKATGAPTYVFTKAQIDANEIEFVHDGSENEPDYLVTVSDDHSLQSAAQHPVITFENTNDAPEITNNSFTVTEGGQVTILSSHISATDVDSSAANLRFRVTTDDAIGHFAYATDPDTAIDNFTQGQILAEEIVFVHKGSENTPTYLISVEDDAVPAESTTAVNGTVTVIPVNDLPELVASDITITEDQTLQLDTTMLTATDVDNSLSDLTYQISNPQACFFAHEDNMTTPIEDFSHTDLAAGKIFVIHDGSETIPECDVTVSDGVDTTVATQINFTFNPQNDAPTITNLATSDSYKEDAAKLLSGISIEDVDGSTSYEVTLELSDLLAGSFSESSNTTASSSFSAGVLTITGPDINDVNAILAATTFTPTGNYNDNVTITISATDGITPATDKIKTLNAIAVNDAPTITTLSTSESYTEDTTLSLSDISIADIDGATTYQVSLDLSDDSAGTLSAIDTGTATGIFAGGTLSVSGTDINDINAVLATTIFTPASNYNADLTVTITATDGITPATAKTKTLQGIAVNDAPIASPLNQSGTYTEDITYDLQNIVVSDVDADEIISAQMTLAAAGHGSLSTAGGANFDAATGVWSISGSAATVNNALSLVTFTPVADSFANTSITVQIEDGNEDGVSPLTGTISLAGKAVADAPIVSTVGTLASTPSDPIYITASDADGAEITHFQITEISDGELYLNDGLLTPVSENDFISLSDGTAGLIFTLTSDSNGSFKVIGSDNGTTVAPESTVTTSAITVTNSKITIPGDTSGPTDNGGKTIEEDLEIVEEINSIDETLNLVAGQVISDGESLEQPSDSSTSEEIDTQSTEKSETDSGEEDVKDTLSYANALTKANTNAASGLAISAAFENLSFDISFADTTVRSFSFSSGLSQNIKTGSGAQTTDSDTMTIFSSADYNLLDLEYRDRTFEEYQSVRKSLESFREQTEQEASIEKTVVGSAIAASTGLSAGYVIWLLRSGALLSSILSSLPAWQLADPLAVLAGAKRREDEEDDSIESIIEKGAKQPSAKTNQQRSQQDKLAD